MAASFSVKLNCRYYQSRFPQLDEIVMVNVNRIQDMGAYCTLLEYNDIEGMILMSEVSRRRIRSLNKHLRVGRNECVAVIRVDEVKGYIDLSKKRVSTEEAEKFQERFIKSKTINQILRHVADTLKFQSNEEFEELYQNTAWAIDVSKDKKGACYDIFKKAAIEPSILNPLNLDENTRDALLNSIRRRLAHQPVKLRATFELNCYSYEGIEAIKHALRAGLMYSTGDPPLQINLIAPPEYIMTTTTLDQNEGVAKLLGALAVIKQSIEEKHGSYNILVEPKIATELDDMELENEMKHRELANREVDGDDSNSEND
ncbi:Eukaryotic translation initiation factor 2 subunit 1 [Oopsacas minuta]|uniref:Eukaryotic translation initiation factor 2 subunit 1 n=1 Tax=Oopsacas minuta TaxID=111878 RepID=A0AAV7JSX5_9METZ|nr:Eukaryotic translation initiation factor 2 subunit 1 [Oopsacas minuta]